MTSGPTRSRRHRRSDYLVLDGFHEPYLRRTPRCTHRATAARRASSYLSLLSPLDTDAEVRNGPLDANVEKQFNFIDNFSLTARAHQLKFGAAFDSIQPPTAISMVLILRRTATLVCRPAPFDSVLPTISGTPITAAINNYSFFVQDIWKVSLRLTLTYGLRWEINTPMRSVTPGKPLYAE